MKRIASLYRLCRTVVSLWAWRSPLGVACFIRVSVDGRRVAVLLTDGGVYLTSYGRWTAMDRAAIHARLDEVALVLADQRKLIPHPEPEPWSPTIAMASVKFEAGMEELRARGHVLPMGEKRKGGA